MDKIVQIGSIANGPWDNPSVGRVYDQNGLAPTLNSGGGVAKGNHTSSRRLKHMDQIVVAMRGRDKGGGGASDTRTTIQWMHKYPYIRAEGQFDFGGRR